MEDKAPNACGFCVNLIETKFTQPCAFRSHTLHDFSRRENHCRDPATYALSCLTNTRCNTEPVLYLESTRKQPHKDCMAELHTEV